MSAGAFDQFPLPPPLAGRLAAAFPLPFAFATGLGAAFGFAFAFTRAFAFTFALALLPAPASIFALAAALSPAGLIQPHRMLMNWCLNRCIRAWIDGIWCVLVRVGSRRPPCIQVTLKPPLSVT